jgi:predicted molibdopterin-dependent oxidoreductase YjgC
MGAVPDHLPGPCALDDASARLRLTQVWKREPALEHGLDIEQMIHEVAGLIVVADDPPVSLPSEGSARKALARLECLIVLDAFVTPTVDAAHVALPIASPAETEGTFTSMEGRVQWLRAGASPPGDVRPGWQVLAELGAALGLPPAPGSVHDVVAAIRTAVPTYAQAPEREEARTLRGLPQVSRPRGGPSEGVTARGDPPGGPATEAGDAAAFPLRLVRAGVFEWGDDPLVVSSPTLRRDHASLRKRFPHGLIEMSGQDARALGIRDGWQVKLVSRRGEVLVPVSVRDDVEPRTALVPFAFRDSLVPALGDAPQVAARVERT